MNSNRNGWPVVHNRARRAGVHSSGGLATIAEECAMDRKTLNVALCAILETLDETTGGCAPESVLYMALDAARICDAWEPARNVLSSALLVRFTGGEATITPAGREMAEVFRRFRQRQNTVPI